MLRGLENLVCRLVALLARVRPGDLRGILCDERHYENKVEQGRNDEIARSTTVFRNTGSFAHCPSPFWFSADDSSMTAFTSVHHVKNPL